MTNMKTKMNFRRCSAIPTSLIAVVAFLCASALSSLSFSLSFLDSSGISTAISSPNVYVGAARLRGASARSPPAPSPRRTLLGLGLGALASSASGFTYNAVPANLPNVPGAAVGFSTATSSARASVTRQTAPPRLPAQLSALTYDSS